MDFNRIFDGYSERHNNILLFKPLIDLYKNTYKSYKELNLMEVGEAILLFMLNEMLQAKRKITRDTLNNFLMAFLQKQYDLHWSTNEVDEFRKFIVDDKLRNGGNRFFTKYRDYSTGEERAYSFDLIVYDEFSIEGHRNNDLNLKLSPEGVELLFKTKEAFAEMQISITMLYFKQQLERSEFGSALVTVRELNLQILNEINKIENYNEQIRNNVMSVFNRAELEKHYESSRKQTEKERHQIKEQKQTVSSVKQSYVAGNLSVKQKRAYEQILKIEDELNKCDTKHSILYKKKFQLLDMLSSTLQSMIQNAFSKSYHFEQELLQNWVNKRINQDKVHSVLKPVMPIKRVKVYNPFLAYSEQVVRRKRDEEEQKEDAFDEIAAEEELEAQREIEEQEYEVEYESLKRIMLPLLDKEGYVVSDIFDQMKEEDNLAYKQFCEDELDLFLNATIKLHRSDYKKFEYISADDPDLPYESDEVRMISRLVREYPDFEDIKGFLVTTTDDEIEFDNGVRMTNYIIERDESAK